MTRGVAKNAVQAAGGLERLAEHAVDALDDRQRRDRSDLVADVIVVGEVGDGEVRQRASRRPGRTASRRVDASSMPKRWSSRPSRPALCPCGVRVPTKSPSESTDGPSTVSVNGTPGSAAMTARHR